MDCYQLKQFIIKPALTAINFISDDAVYLLLGTCAQESHLGHYVVQQGINFKGGIGIYQMERLTYNKLWDKHIGTSLVMKNRIKLFLGYSGRPDADRMATDLNLATIMARIFYIDVKEKLPDHKDIHAMAAYWKKYYNTIKGKGTEEEFIDNYKRFVKC